MILNRTILMEQIGEVMAQKVMTRVLNAGIGFDKMSKDSIDNLRPMVHFKREDFIKLTEEKLKTMKSNHKPINVKLLELVKGIK